jgi:hypothetical protein
MLARRREQNQKKGFISDLHSSGSYSMSVARVMDLWTASSANALPAAAVDRPKPVHMHCLVDIQPAACLPELFLMLLVR